METGAAAFITPIQSWADIKGFSAGGEKQEINKEETLFKDIFNNAVRQVRDTQADVEQKQYLLATGQLDDAHTLPIAEAKAALSLDVLVSLRNKAMESYSELMKMSI